MKQENPLEIQSMPVWVANIGKTLMGYKGGDFLMGKTTPVWVANIGKTLMGYKGGDFPEREELTKLTSQL